jgi:hypothetical protein
VPPYFVVLVARPAANAPRAASSAATLHLHLTEPGRSTLFQSLLLLLVQLVESGSAAVSQRLAREFAGVLPLGEGFGV